LDAKRRLAGVSALARWNWSRGGWWLIACMTPIVVAQDGDTPIDL
jgi:hypothetical protein